MLLVTSALNNERTLSGEEIAFDTEGMKFAPGSYGLSHNAGGCGGYARWSCLQSMSAEQQDSVREAGEIYAAVILAFVPGPEDAVLASYALTKTGKVIAKFGDEALATIRGAKAVKFVSAPVEKFSEYIFKDGADHGKDAVFRALGYGKEHAEKLALIWQKQAAKAYANGNYTLGKLDQYGQRINIEISLPGIGKSKGKVSHMNSGWMINKDGSIRLNTPFSGFTR